jgi:cytochrome c-type biogenesis protein CcmH/NrfG
MTWVVILPISAALAAVAAFGILRPYRRGRAIALERLTDPLEDERTTLLRTLRDLDDDRASGVLSARDHAALRAETEVRAVAVLRALEARDGDGESAPRIREVRSTTISSPAVPPEANGSGAADGPDGSGSVSSPARGRSRGSIAALSLGAILTIAIVPLLIGAISQRGAGGSLSGDTGIAGSAAPGSTSAADPGLAAFERRVRQAPRSVSARLDLAERYVRDRRSGLAAVQFSEALRLDPTNVEAHTGLAAILFDVGRFDDALFLVNDALATSPRDPEALYRKGVILMRGLDRPQEAAQAFRAYLAAAPFGAHRDEVRALLAGLPPSPP